MAETVLPLTGIKKRMPQRGILLCLGGVPDSVLLLFYRLEIFFSYAANRANPIFGEVFKSNSRSDSCIRIAYFRIVNPIANSANVFFHNLLCFKLVIIVRLNQKQI